MSATTSTPSTRGPVVDADHPWLGLQPFTEENQHYFFGRSTEIREVFLRIREQTLTVLFAQSGLGKTSLLRAGLIPKLRAERFRPIRVLLEFGAHSPPLVAQVRTALAAGCADDASESAAALLERWKPLGTLWEIFAHERLRPALLAEHTPVLIFDQFEEVFTLGEEKGARGAEVRELIVQLADLIENRAPLALRGSFEKKPERAMTYDFGPTPARVVFSLREDFLSQLESWKATLPSLMRNRMPLRLLNGPQALEAVVRPGRRDGRNLVSDEVGAQIVRFVAQREADTPLEEIEAVPPLVSLLCERLNAARLDAEPALPQITAGLVESQVADILQHFYDESFATLPEGIGGCVREFVEERMVTVGGHRNHVAREDACAELAEKGVPDPAGVLDGLILRRLLVSEWRGGIQRLEITHDVLTPLVVRARNERHLAAQATAREQQARAAAAEAAAAAERQAEVLRRTRRTAIAFAALGLLALGGLVFATLAWRGARREREEAERQTGKAEDAEIKAKRASERAQESAEDAKVAAQRSTDSISAAEEQARRLVNLVTDKGSGLPFAIAFKLLDVASEFYDKINPEADAVPSVLSGRIYLQFACTQPFLNQNGKSTIEGFDDAAERAILATDAAVEIATALSKRPDATSEQALLLSLAYFHRGAVIFSIMENKATIDQTRKGIKTATYEKARADYKKCLDLLDGLLEREPAMAKRGEIVRATVQCQIGLADTLRRLHTKLHPTLEDAEKLLIDGQKRADQATLLEGGKYVTELTALVADTYNKLGNVKTDESRASDRERTARLEEALKNYRMAYDIRKMLRDQSSNNLVWQRNLAISCANLAGCYAELEKYADAKMFFEQRIALDQELYQQDQSNIYWRDALAEGWYAYSFQLHYHPAMVKDAKLRAMELANRAIEITQRRNPKFLELYTLVSGHGAENRSAAAPGAPSHGKGKKH